MRRITLHACVGLAMALPACSQQADRDQPVRGQVMLACDSDAPILVSYGTGWVPPNSAGRTRVDADGSFSIPRTAGAVNAYVDTNGNGVLDRFVEPAGACTLEEGRWNCRIARQRAIVHRSTTSYLGALAGQPGEEIQDSTFYFAEAFDRACASIDDLTLCSSDGSRCSNASLPPFRDATIPVQTISSCGEGDVGPAEMNLQTPFGTTAVRLVQPQALGVSATLERSEAESVLHVETSTAVSRILAWAAPVSTRDRSVGRALWHSEQAGFTVVSEGTHHSVTIPTPALEACRREPGCVLIVQALHLHWDGDAAMVLGEGRLVGVAP